MFGPVQLVSFANNKINMTFHAWLAPSHKGTLLVVLARSEAPLRMQHPKGAILKRAYKHP